MYFYNSFKFYFLSFLTLIFQFLFLATIKEFGDEFNIYIQIMAINAILISFIGSIQFYFKKEKEFIYLNFLKKSLVILFIVIIGISIHYILFDLRWFIFFITSIISLIFFSINVAYNTRFNFFEKNTKLLFYFSILKFICIYFAFKYNLDILFFLVLSNLFVSMLSLRTIGKITFILNKENGFSIKSIINNTLGTGNTTIDKLYCSNYATYISVNYFIIFKVASVFQYFTEVLFRKERFIITEGKFKIDNKIIALKFFTVFFFIILLNFLIEKYGFILNYINNKNLNFIYSFFEIIINYNDEFSLIAFAFLLNSISGLTYDKIYRNFGNNFLLIVNFLNVFLFIILLFLFGNSIINMSIIFLIIHILNYFFIKFIDLFVIKKFNLK